MGPFREGAAAASAGDANAIAASPQASSKVEQVQAGVPANGTLQPLQADAGAATVVNWALDGLISSVKSRWGVAIARANDHVHFVERGIDIKGTRPDLWHWLSGTMEAGGASPETQVAAPQDSSTLAWALLRTDSGLVGAMLLGRDRGGDPFSKKDRIWLERVGERVASILCYTSDSDLGAELGSDQSAPAAVWAGPVLDKVRWARGWMKGQFKARECWLFLASEGSPVPQLVDEKWGAAGPSILQETVQKALERRDPQVWLERDGGRALVLQPLGRWGVKGLLLLEDIPWRGDGAATLARLKKAAATIAKLLNNI
jgi:hypothetical protein